MVVYCPEEQVSSDLRVAVTSGDASRVQDLLLGAEEYPDKRDSSGEGLLHLAAELGHTEVATALLSSGANIEAIRGSNQLTPLSISTGYGHLGVTIALLNAGADTGARNDFDHSTPLHAAVESGLVEITCALLQSGADLESKDSFGNTPLSWAVSLGYVGMTVSLLSAGAHRNTRDNQGRTPLHTAARKENSSLAITLLEAGADPNIQDNRGYTPLHIAAREGHLGVVVALLKAGADISLPNTDRGYTVLHLAAAPSVDHTEVTRVLLEAGADVEATSWDGHTALHLACLNAAPGCVKELLRWGADASCPKWLLKQQVKGLAGLVSHLDGKTQSVNGRVGGLSALVGGAMPDMARDRMGEEEVCKMLLRVPSDRAWRRRGWLIMLHKRMLSSHCRKRVRGIEWEYTTGNVGNKGCVAVRSSSGVATRRDVCKMSELCIFDGYEVGERGWMGKKYEDRCKERFQDRQTKHRLGCGEHSCFHANQLTHRGDDGGRRWSSRFKEGRSRYEVVREESNSNEQGNRGEWEQLIGTCTSNDNVCKCAVLFTCKRLKCRDEKGESMPWVLEAHQRDMRDDHSIEGIGAVMEKGVRDPFLALVVRLFELQGDLSTFRSVVLFL